MEKYRIPKLSEFKEGFRYQAPSLYAHDTYLNYRYPNIFHTIEEIKRLLKENKIRVEI